MDFGYGGTWWIFLVVDFKKKGGYVYLTRLPVPNLLMIHTKCYLMDGLYHLSFHPPIIIEQFLLPTSHTTSNS